MRSSENLDVLRREFLAGTTASMPIAGMVFWAVIGLAALRVSPNTLALMVLFGSGMIFPLGALLDLLRGRRMQRADMANPVMKLFMQSLGLVALTWPLVILAARLAHDVNVIVLGGAILMGIIWIPYGWAANDPVGMEHAVGRAVLSYAAFLFAPAAYRPSAIALAVLVSYAYSLVRMRRSGTATGLGVGADGIGNGESGSGR